MPPVKYSELMLTSSAAAGLGYCSAVSTAESEGVISLQNRSGTEGISYENDLGGTTLLVLAERVHGFEH